MQPLSQLALMDKPRIIWFPLPLQCPPYCNDPYYQWWYFFWLLIASIFAWTRGLLHRAKLDGKNSFFVINRRYWPVVLVAIFVAQQLANGLRKPVRFDVAFIRSAALKLIVLLSAAQFSFCFLRKRQPCQFLPHFGRDVHQYNWSRSHDQGSCWLHQRNL